MYEEPRIECDKCGNDVKSGSDLYCDDCFEELIEENRELKKHIEELEAEQ